MQGLAVDFKWNQIHHHYFICRKESMVFHFRISCSCFPCYPISITHDKKINNNLVATLPRRRPSNWKCWFLKWAGKKKIPGEKLSFLSKDRNRAAYGLWYSNPGHFPERREYATLVPFLTFYNKHEIIWHKYEAISLQFLSARRINLVSMQREKALGTSRYLVS